MNKTCTDCGIEKHIQQFSLSGSIDHTVKTIKTLENTEDTCRLCKRKSMAQERLDKANERKQWLNRVWV